MNGEEVRVGMSLRERRDRGVGRSLGWQRVRLQRSKEVVEWSRYKGSEGIGEGMMFLMK